MNTTYWNEPEDVPPTGGEYHMSRTRSINETTTSTGTNIMSAKEMRERNAFGYWFEDSSGAVQKGGSRSSQPDLSASHGEIDEWMSLLEPCTNNTNNENVDDGASASSSSTTDDTAGVHSPDMLWFHLACPVRETRVSQT
jgi:hypothetical protein